jgi:hypothetical protein
MTEEFDKSCEILIQKLQSLSAVDDIDRYQDRIQQAFNSRRSTLSIAVNVRQDVINAIRSRMSYYTREALWQIKPPENYPYIEKLGLDLTTRYYCPGPSTTTDKNTSQICEYKSTIDWQVQRPFEGFEFDHWILRTDIKEYLLSALTIIAKSVMDIESSLTRFPHHATLLSYFSTFDFEADIGESAPLSIARRSLFLKSFLIKHPRKYELEPEEQLLWNSLTRNDFVGHINITEDPEEMKRNKPLIDIMLGALWKVMALRFIHDYIDVDKYIDDLYGSNIVVRCRRCHQKSYTLHPRYSTDDAARYILPLPNIDQVVSLSVNNLDPNAYNISRLNTISTSNTTLTLSIEGSSESNTPVDNQSDTLTQNPDSRSVTADSSPPPTMEARGRAPYGWKYNDSRTLFIHDEEQQRNIELIKNIRRTRPHLTFNAISTHMNTQGIIAKIILDRNGNIIRRTKFNPPLIQSILHEAQLL